MSEKYDNIYSCSAFCKGKSVVIFKNKETMEYYFTIIDESGNIAFEPKCIGEKYSYIQYDGECVAFVLDIFHPKMNCYSLDGNELSTFGTGDVGMLHYMGDNSIMETTSISNFDYRITYYDLNHNPLF